MTLSSARLTRAERLSAGKEKPEATVLPPPRFPNIVEFVSSPQYLGRLKIYPGQLFLLKLTFLAVDLLTAFDRRLLTTLTAGFTRAEGTDDTAGFEGTRGLQPDVLQRIERCLSEGRLWFRDVIAIIGRRGSKGYLAAIATAYVVYWYITQENPQARIGIDANKVLNLAIFAGNKTQAIDNQWADLVDLIGNAPCFALYRCEPTTNTLRLYSHQQIAGGKRPPKRQAAFNIFAAETTPRSIRGRSAIAILLDESAHMVATGASRGAEEIWNAAKPALSQCGPQGMFGFSWQGSSPWAMIGQPYNSYRAGLAIDPETGEAIAYDTFVVQLASWDLYEGFELTQSGDLEMAPGGPTFLPIDEPVMAFDERMQRERAQNPEDFDTEYGGQWSATQDRYLPIAAVDAMFAPWPDTPLPMQTRGILSIDYHAHADPSSVNDLFGFVVGHAEPNETPILDIVLDLIDYWDPAKFANNTIDYVKIENDIAEHLDNFQTVRELSFDQHNSTGLVQRLQAHANQPGRPVRTSVSTITNSQATKLDKYELFKKLLLMGRIHAPAHELARLELLFLRRIGDRIDHQPSGTICTNDIADCLVEVTYRLAGPDSAIVQQLRDRHLRGALPGGIPREAGSWASTPEGDAIAALFARSRRQSRFGHGTPRGNPRGAGRPRW